VFGRDVEERGQNPGNSGTPRPNYNVLFTAAFFLRKKEKVAKTTGHKIYPDVAEKKEVFLS